MFERVKAALKNRAVLAVTCFALGGVATGLFLQEKIIKVTKVSEAHEKAASELKAQLDSVRIQSNTIGLSKDTHRERTSEKRPDGTVLTHETIDTHSASLSKTLERSRDEYLSTVRENRTTDSASHEVTNIHTNPRRLVLFAGIDLLRLDARVYYGGFSYNVWGPLTIGGIAGSNGLLVPTIGIRF